MALNCGDCLMEHAEVIELCDDNSCWCCKNQHRRVNWKPDGLVGAPSDGWPAIVKDVRGKLAYVLFLTNGKVTGAQWVDRADLVKRR